MDQFTVGSCVRGHHVSNVFWAPTVGETLRCERESEDAVDPYAVAVLENATIVGHVPRKISIACNLFLRRSGSTIHLFARRT